MINRELIRLKVVQLVYSYYQNEGKTLDVAEKELSFSLQKAYELYEYLLSLLVELKKHAERKDSVRVAREKRTGTAVGGVAPDKLFAENKFLVQLSDNKALIDYQENTKGQWDEEPAFVKNLYVKMVESDVFQLYLTREDFHMKPIANWCASFIRLLFATTTTSMLCSKNTRSIGMMTSRW